ncbi:tRNA-specific adenosine deaminase [Deinococcus carri]|uniref:tRNA-specific adenosine deaminase n=1 Tax=Deinococcus carri TaxID=1211323 RepID=A0ABP9W935_9DEIO
MRGDVGRGLWDVGKDVTPQPTAHIPQPWLAALAQAWEAYLHGSYPIGAVVVDAAGEVIARGRNRLGEARGAEGGVISGHDLAHAEINALLNLAATPRPECYGWTVLTTVEPCPQCAGAIAMSGLRAVEYAAPDPWGGCTRLLTDDPYVSRKGIRVGRAPESVGRAALRLALVGFLEEGYSGLDRFLQAFHEYGEDLAAARELHDRGTLRDLRSRGAALAEVLDVLDGGAA